MQKNSFLPKIRQWIAKNKAIDAVIFGSFARSKSKPGDIDLCILIKDEDEKKSLDLITSLGELTDQLNLNAHITVLTSSAFTSGDTLAKTLLNEGYSIRHNQSFALRFGLSSKSLFIYSLKKFTPSQRVRFHYLLKGRYGTKGMLKEAEGKFIGTGTIIVPVEKEDLLKEVFETWKVDYHIQRAMLS